MESSIHSCDKIKEIETEVNCNGIECDNRLTPKKKKIKLNINNDDDNHNNISSDASFVTCVDPCNDMTDINDLIINDHDYHEPSPDSPLKPLNLPYDEKQKLIDSCKVSFVDVKYTIEELKDECIKQNIVPNLEYKKSNDDAYGVYEVESIYDWTENSDGKIKYYVKWKNYDDNHNTWEPLSNLRSCDDIVKEFNAALRLSKETPESIKWYLNYRRLRTIIDDIYERKIDRETSNAVLMIFSGERLKDFKYFNSTFDKLRKSTNELCQNVFTKVSAAKKYDKRIIEMGKALNMLHQKLNINRRYNSWEEFFEYFTKRKHIQIQLNLWQRKINRIIASENEGNSIRIENYIDLEGPVNTFTYIGKCKPLDETIVVSDDPPLFCTCTDCAEEEKQCCPVNNGYSVPYTKKGTLKLAKKTAIYECNKKCSCGDNCCNRVVQKGRKNRLVIFRTDNGCGWGVRTLDRIMRGSFVMEYIGELITVEEADRRGRVYDTVGRTYLFDLDYDDDDYKYTVDAINYGNVAHFVNHSCDPNLETACVWINNLDPHMPHIALFARRDIKQNEELTFDYKIPVSYHGAPEVSENNLVSVDATQLETLTDKDKLHDISDDSGISGTVSNSSNYSSVRNGINRTKCRCGALNCRGFVN